MGELMDMDSAEWIAGRAQTALLEYQRRFIEDHYQINPETGRLEFMPVAITRRGRR